MNLSGTTPPTQYFEYRTPWTVDLIDGFGSLSPGLYSLTNFLNGYYVPVGSLSFNFNATPSLAYDNYLSLIIVANNNSSYSSIAWRIDQNAGDGICLSSSYCRIPVASVATAQNYIAYFSINGMITITPDTPYLHIFLCTQLLNNSNWSFNNYVTSPGYICSPGSSSGLSPSLYLKPLS